uniref:DDE_Tnp_1_7 domain-containing protein n=1 Tax=Strongyloides stercoralis TaxID=6248 RepID=A0A0K0EC24_STRER
MGRNKIKPSFQQQSKYSVTENMKRIPMEETLCVDEQMIPFKGKHSIKQYMKKKPRKWGFKAFVLCDSNGITHNWELYTGASLSSTELPNVGVSGNIVLRLCSIVPKNLNYKVYFDNWFNNIPLQVELEKTGLNYLGTIRPNRLKGCQFSSDKDMRRKGRGTMEEYYTIVDDIRIIATKWFDNKPVHLLSSFVGIKPVTTIKRYDRQQNKKIDVDFPESIKFYNRFMGGVDLADSLISLYRTEIRSKKWYLKIFFHILDLSVVNGWLLYRRDCNYFKIEAKNQYNLLDFKSELANTLCQKGLRCNIRVRPRSTEIEHGLSEKRKRGPTVSVPPKEVRLDQTSH